MSPLDCAALRDGDRAAGGRRAGHAGTARPPGGAAPPARPAWRWRVRLERVLDRMAGRRAGAGFRPAVWPRRASEAWRREQVVDWGFNVAIAAGLVAIVVGLAAMVWLLGSAAGPGAPPPR